ncbi:MAG: flippase, partial [Deltaproteobacteria bacterium]|nr:flippase [Deltaproteobacteria bacterium]
MIRLPAFIRARMEGRVALQQAIKNTGWLFVDRCVRMGLGLLVGVAIARYLGPKSFGVFSYAGSFVLLFTATASLGLDGIVVRTIVRDPSSRDEVLGTTFVLKALGATFSFAVAVAAIAVLRPGDALSRWLVGVLAGATILQAFDTIDYWFQSQVKSKYVILAKGAAFLSISVVRLVLVWLKAPLLAFAWAALAEAAVAGLGLVIAYVTQGNVATAWRATVAMARTLLRDSWPLILSEIAGAIYLRIDQVMLGQMVGEREVGVYAVAVRLAEVWYFLPMILYSSLLPSIIEAKAIGEDLFYGRLQHFYNIMTLMGYAVAVPITLFSGFLVKLLFGSAYAAAGPMLAVLVWAGIFVNLGVARSSFLMAMNWTRLHFLTVVLGGLTNVALNLVLIPKYGGLGAAIAS